MGEAQQWGTWAGLHPLTVWATALLLGLATAAAAHMGTRRALPYCTPWMARWPRPTGPVAVLAAMGGAGLLLWACVEALTRIAAHWAGTGDMGVLDQALADTLRAQAFPATLALFSYLTHAGDVLTLWLLATAVAVALWRRGHRLLATGWAAAMAGNGLLTRAFKHTFERVRPVHTHEWAVADGFSFPSGHSSASLVAYGMLAYLAARLLPARWHLPALLAAVAVTITVGWSRVVLQVHFASDVLAGWLTGGAWLACCLLVLHGAAHWHRCRTAPAA